MSTKKRFTIAPELAKGIRSTIQSASTNQGQLHYDMMPLDAIEPDPANPRKLSISYDEMRHGLNPTDIHYQTKLKEREALQELAESIKRIGIRHAIEVYKEGTKYRIITGERRYFAAMLAGHQSVPVRITAKLDEFHLRYTQWVENISRQDLLLGEKLNNLILIAESYQATHPGEFTEAVLQRILGVSPIQAYRYFCLLKAEAQIISLVRMGKINNLKLVQELVSMKDKGARNQIIAWILASKDEVSTLASYRAAAGKKTSSMTRKHTQSISLGKVAGVNAARQVLDILLTDERLNRFRHGFNRIDWHSPKAITKAFNDLFKAIEKESIFEEIG